jgi:predicted RNA binding protein YcfA (HicA-like mRNA interferase family)
MSPEAGMSEKLPRGVTYRELLRRLQKAGWEVRRRKGARAHLRHPSRPERLTLHVHPADVVLPKTLASILHAAGLTVAEFEELR